ncbi:MAG: DNA/RNA non-specific endonuclease, partial [Bacteroidota bacterium]|nr:DNA/RNA non-specific endonuclease [Bacteroidota bacterium]
DLPNVAAQTPPLNRGAWKRTQPWSRSAALLYRAEEVISLPVFLDRDTIRVGSHHVAVPHAFFKAAWLPATDSIIGVWFFFNR